MLKLLKTNTIQLTPSEITVSWEFESSQEDFNSYRLYVYESQGPNDDMADYELVASGVNPYATSYISDTNIYGVNDKFVDLFYRIAVSGVSNHAYEVCEPFGITVTADKYAREIERRRNIVFNFHSSQTFFALKRKAFGTMCPACYDSTLQRTTQSKCLSCYDTGYVGGYYAPIQAKGQFNERPTREAHQLFGSWQDQDAVLYLPATPPLNPKDIIIDRLSRRWIVLNVGASQKAMHTIGQIVQMRQIEKDDVLHQYYVNTQA